MCHKKLEMRFVRNVNFINGQNGSGKSAILAALQVRPHATPRNYYNACTNL
jgi:predicted ATPase